LKESALLAEQERHQREDPGNFEAGTELLKNGLFMVFTIKTLEKMGVAMV